MAIILSETELDSLAATLADRVARILVGRAPHSGIRTSSTLASALSQPIRQDSARIRPGGRFVSEGMLNLASAVSYKLSKGDPEKAEFNRIASEVAKLLASTRADGMPLPIHDPSAE